MDIRKLEKIPEKKGFIPVKVTTAGNIVDVQYVEHRNSRQTILKLSSEEYMIVSTGEICKSKKHETRQENIKELRKTFALARGLINANVTDVSKVRWCTLTYVENMTDTKKLYKDFRDFNKRFKRYCEKSGWSSPEYIVMMEPQGRGAWHAHLLYIWNDMQAPYISNEIFSELWGHGFVKIKKLDNVDNVGAYLTAYLGDMELNEAERVGVSIAGCEVKLVDAVDDDGKPILKRYVKGLRLSMYPSGFNMIRSSRGVKRPVSEMMSQVEASKKVSAATKTFESALELSDESNGFKNIIIREQYNTVREKKQ